eukprot:15442816-Alexandrium_andersonii.AAC.1
MTPWPNRGPNSIRQKIFYPCRPPGLRSKTAARATPRCFSGGLQPSPRPPDWCLGRERPRWGGAADPPRVLSAAA